MDDTLISDNIGCFILEGCLNRLMEYSWPKEKYTLTEKGHNSLLPIKKSLDRFLTNGENYEEISLLLESASTDSPDERAFGVYLNSIRSQKTPKFWEWVSLDIGNICDIVEKNGITFYTFFCEALIYLREKIKTEERVYAG